jgi:hypothetical protein
MMGSRATVVGREERLDEGEQSDWSRESRATKVGGAEQPVLGERSDWSSGGKKLSS